MLALNSFFGILAKYDMSTLSADPTADILLRQIRLIKRIGSPAQKAAAPRWEFIIHQAADAPESQAVNFATADKPHNPEAGK